MARKPKPFDPEWHHTKAAIALSLSILPMASISGFAFFNIWNINGRWWVVLVLLLMQIVLLVWMFSLATYPPRNRQTTEDS